MRGCLRPPYLQNVARSGRLPPWHPAQLPPAAVLTASGNCVILTVSSASARCQGLYLYPPSLIALSRRGRPHNQHKENGNDRSHV